MDLPVEIFGYTIPWNIMLESREAIGIALLWLVTIIVLMLLAREFVCWFWKIPSQIAGHKITQSLLDEQNELIANNTAMLSDILDELRAQNRTIADPIIRSVIKKNPNRIANHKKETPTQEKNPTL